MIIVSAGVYIKEKPTEIMLEMNLVILLSIGAVIFAAIGMGRTHHSTYNSKHVIEEYREIMDGINENPKSRKPLESDIAHKGISSGINGKSHDWEPMEKAIESYRKNDGHSVTFPGDSGYKETPAHSNQMSALKMPGKESLSDKLKKYFHISNNA